MQVAVCQMASTADLEANREGAAATARAQALAGADLVVLPEATSRPFPGTAGTAPVGVELPAEALDGPFVQALAGAVAGTGATVVAGTFEPAGDGRTYNTLVVVNRDGLVASYRKLHLFDALGWKESDHVAPGDPVRDGVCVRTVAGVRIGLMTCFDLRFPEMGRMLVDQGAEVLVVPAAWVHGPGKAEQWEVLLRARAMESTAYACGAGQPGPTYCGTSMVVDPRGTVTGRLGADATGCLAASVDPALVAEVRATLPVLALRRFHVRPRCPVRDSSSARDHPGSSS